MERKNIFLFTILAVILLVAAAQKETAPNSRIGYASSRNIIKQLAETQKALVELDTLSRQLDRQFTLKVSEYEAKVQSFKKDEPGLNAVVKKDRQDELDGLKASITKFQQTSEQAFKQREEALMRPIYERVQKVFDEVAVEHRFTHIFNIDSKDFPLMLYAEKGSRVDGLVLARINQHSKK